MGAQKGTGKFAKLVLGVFVSFIAYGYIQELLFRTKGLKQFGWYITLVQFIVYTALSAAEIRVRKIVQTQVPLGTFVVIAFFTVATMGLSNSSLAYLNYPTQVVFKSCKLIPVMLGGVLIQRKRYGPRDYLASGLLSLGLIVFTLADVKISPRYSVTGMVLISLALCADAVIGNIQERVMRKNDVTAVEMVHKSYKIGIGFLLVVCIATGELFNAFAFCAEHSVTKTYIPMVLFATSGYIGVNFVLALVKEYGALTAVTVTTLRKAVTMVLSFVIFPKPFTIGYVWGGLILLAGLALNTANKRRSKKLAAMQLPTKHPRSPQQI